ncbi:hypothetical protein B0F90DRAFT_1813589 [Multifurca ochricompacta]|uniref:Microsomal glutathione S-transferase 3 n=1 Tax=Multifurca ochricompacta TaxID=376703 RepID=A0AAD4QUB3_9AGAM|nr:hypothetical protein B0F90DRAFT_1813589 [Multifurca ochricompacta]
MSTILVPAGFSWITLSLVSVATLLQWQALAVGKARRKAGVTYPRPYADKAEQEASNDALIFNCLQRAHQNTLENIPVIVITTLIGALRYPVSAALACGLWSFARVVYTKGYASGDPKRVDAT